MKSKLIIVIYIVTAIAIRTNIVQGLQCYVCDYCNEYEDFKELQICGEISVITTSRPSTIPNTLVTNPVTMVNASVTTLKPSGSSDTDDYMYEYSMDPLDGTGATTNKQKGDVNRTGTTVLGATFPTTLNIQNQDGKATTNKQMGDTNPTGATIIETTFSTALNTRNQDGKESTIVPTTMPTTFLAANVETNASPNAVTTLKAVQQPLDYDYLEYDEPKVVNANLISKAAASGSLLRINEPVCYMFRYLANNTVFTKRGCTTSINDNTYLTCQSLYNGQPISGCRICSTDGCNKYAHDESEEDHIYNAGVVKQLSIVVVAMLAFVTALFV